MFAGLVIAVIGKFAAASEAVHAVGLLVAVGGAIVVMLGIVLLVQAAIGSSTEQLGKRMDEMRARLEAMDQALRQAVQMGDAQTQARLAGLAQTLEACRAVQQDILEKIDALPTKADLRDRA